MAKNSHPQKLAGRSPYPFLDIGKVREGHLYFNWNDAVVIDIDVSLYGMVFDVAESYEDYDGIEHGFMATYQDKYDSERELYKVLQMEAFNINGLPILYHIRTYDTEYDPLFGEDDTRRIERVFSCMGYMPELPSNYKNWNSFAIEGLDSFVMHYNKEHFKVASSSEVDGRFRQSSDNELGMYPNQFTENFVPSDSATGTQQWDNQFDNNAFSQEFQIDFPIERNYIPKVGDIIKIGYNGTFYEATKVGEEEEMFLQDKHTWSVTYEKIMVKDHTEVDADDLNFDSGLDSTMNESDIFDMTDEVETYKESLESVPLDYPDVGKGHTNPLYDPDDDEEGPKDIFGGF